MILKMPDSEYFAIEALSSSGIKQLLKSPAHFMASKYSNKSTPAFRIGTLVHMLILEPERFEVDPTPLLNKKDEPMGKWSSSAAVEQRINKDDYMCLQSEIDTASEIVNKQQDPELLAMLFGGTEPEMVCHFEQDGMTWKAKADAIRREEGLILDLKTTDSIENFERNFFNYGYHIQDSWYRRIFGQEFEVNDFIFVVVEKNAPYGMKYYRTTEDVREFAERKIDEAIEKYKDCMATQEWPCYPTAIQEIKLPGYMK